jgi:hypothetical protein
VLLDTIALVFVLLDTITLLFRWVSHAVCFMGQEVEGSRTKNSMCIQQQSGSQQGSKATIQFNLLA